MSTNSKGNRFVQRNKWWNRWRGLVGTLGCLVVFCTTYALILPAITMTSAEPVMQCSLVQHIHTGACYDENTELICGEVDFVVHTHDEHCYAEDGTLVCTLPEIEEHLHNENCFQTEDELVCGIPEGHTHTDSCYAPVRGELICTESTEAVTEESGEEAAPVHEHTDSCYQWNQQLVCGQEEAPEGHVHTSSCYYAKRYFACTNQAVLHTHTEECRDLDGNLICGRIQVLRHVHGDDCIITTVEELEKQTEETSAEPAEEQETEAAEEAADDTDTADIPVYGSINGTVKAHAGAGAAAPKRSALRSLVSFLAETEPFDLNSGNYIIAQNDDGKKTQLLYKTPDDTEWRDANGATLGGDVSLHQDVVYANVPIQSLLDSGCRMKYTLDPMFRETVADGNIMSGNQTVGHISVSGNDVIITFSEEYLRAQQANNKAYLDGTFYAESQLNLSYIEEHHPGKYHIGDVTIVINFEDDIIAKYGNVEIEKSLNNAKFIQTADGNYLEYKLKVTAGKDGSPDVWVSDTFSSTTYIDEYVGVTGSRQAITDVADVTETGAPTGHGGSVYLGTVTPVDNGFIAAPAGDDAAKPGSMVWEIGDMAPNEVRELVYRVKVKDSYVGTKSQGTLTNNADVFSKTFKRDDDGNIFTPVATATISKSSANPVKKDDGTYTVKYTVTVTADATNSYTLNNVKIYDRLDGYTSVGYKPYVGYDTNTFVLHQGSKASGSVLDTPANPHEGQSNPAMNADEWGFNYYVGDLAPGEARTLTYEVIVGPEVFAVAENAEASLKNRADVVSDDTRTEFSSFKNATNTRKIGQKHWDRKILGDELMEPLTVNMSGAAYDATGGSIAAIENPGSYVAPEGSYLYTVLVNESGDWDVSSASLTDQFGNAHMQFVGYVKVDTFEIIDNVPSGTDAQVLANLNGRTPVETVWVKVDGTTSFNFKPEDIGLRDDNYAIRMTYYAKPVHMDGITEIVVKNEFTMSGQVHTGSHEYILGGIKVESNVTLHGSNRFSAEKLAWYYAPKQNSSDKNKLYWVIKVDADTIPEGTVLKDSPVKASGDRKTNNLLSNSLVGVYIGNRSYDITSYTDINSALDALNAIDSSKYNFKLVSNNTEANLTFKENIALENNESVYVILWTEPTTLPAAKRDAFNYQNKLSHKFPDGGWFDDNVATQYLYGSENILKELQEVFAWDGKDRAPLTPGTGSGLAEAAYRDQPGIYIAWDIKINYMGNLEGTYTITDHIPAGLELVYARIKWLGSGYSDRKDTSHVYTPQKTNLGSEWQEHTITAGTDDCGVRTTYYYTNGSEVCWDVADLIAGNQRDIYSVDCQVLFRVVDSDTLLSGQTKTFNNSVSLTDSNGKDIDSDSCPASVQKVSLTKKGNYDPQINGGHYPFVLTVNPLGQDLIPGKDTVNVVDEMNENLTLIASSVKVIDSKENQELSADQYSYSVKGRTLTLTVPDSMALTITYEAAIDAAPGEPVDIVNRAHWEGYEPDTSSIVEKKNFSYTAGGTVTPASNPDLKIRKLDQNNAQMTLSGAKFTVTEMELQNGAFVPKTNGKVWTDCTTDSSGIVVVGQDVNKLMDWNTVYQVVETQAPDGYVLDSAPLYFAVAKKILSHYPSELDAFKAAGATVYYQSEEYTYQAYNHKGTLTVTKSFQDNSSDIAKVNGDYRFGVYRVENNRETLVEEKTLSIGSGSNNVTVTFDNLDLRYNYRVYEIDDSGNKIADGKMATVGGKVFDVTYPNGNTVTIGNTGTAAVEVKNAVHYTALPHTGGIGTAPLYILGSFLMCAAGVLLLITKKRMRELF